MPLYRNAISVFDLTQKTSVLVTMGFQFTKVLFCFILSVCVVFGQADTTEKTAVEERESIGRQLVEEGRTMVHHAVKRFMIILPAIFFKLGVAFTLLILVTIGVVTNGIIGFMLLVVGLSAVLARLQQAEKPHHHVVPYVGHYPTYSHYDHILKRSDDASTLGTGNLVYGNYQDQYKPSLGYTYSGYAQTN